MRYCSLCPPFPAATAAASGSLATVSRHVLTWINDFTEIAPLCQNTGAVLAVRVGPLQALTGELSRQATLIFRYGGTSAYSEQRCQTRRSVVPILSPKHQAARASRASCGSPSPNPSRCIAGPQPPPALLSGCIVCFNILRLEARRLTYHATCTVCTNE
jgi:hypothetical protein